ncbi:hypothetical protein EDB86DRAFT_1954567 [Lactarius hatsudake]|nr:hypothetical protein EDB86DRAFT_1954567 [Lactarius hatsudake]
MSQSHYKRLTFSPRREHQHLLTAFPTMDSGALSELIKTKVTSLIQEHLKPIVNELAAQHRMLQTHSALLKYNHNINDYQMTRLENLRDLEQSINFKVAGALGFDPWQHPTMGTNLREPVPADPRLIPRFTPENATPYPARVRERGAHRTGRRQCAPVGRPAHAPGLPARPGRPRRRGERGPDALCGAALRHPCAALARQGGSPAGRRTWLGDVQWCGGTARGEERQEAVREEGAEAEPQVEDVRSCYGTDGALVDFQHIGSTV